MGEFTVLIQQLNSFVFVGTFPHGLLDERELFGGSIDFASIVRVNPITHCSYVSGKFELRMTPDRIDLRANETDTIISGELAEAAMIIAEKLDDVKNAVSTTALGMNCDGAIRRSHVGLNGSEYCARLASEAVAQLTGASEFNLSSRISFVEKSIRYTVRIEPHAESSGEHLFVAVNSHQQFEGEETMVGKLQQVGDFRRCVKGIRERIVSDTES